MIDDSALLNHFLMLFSVTIELRKGSVAFVNTGSANSSLDEKLAVDSM